MASRSIQGVASVSALKTAQSTQTQSAGKLSNSFNELNRRINLTIRALKKESARVQKEATRVITPDKIDLKT